MTDRDLMRRETVWLCVLLFDVAAWLAFAALMWWLVRSALVV